MEAQWVADRQRLRGLLISRPDWSRGDLAVSLRGSGLLHSASGVKGAATDCYHIIDWNWGTPTPPCPVMGRENASAWNGGRRRRSSPTLDCNGRDMVKVRQGKPFQRQANG